jgi:Protein of unknown function DUF262/Restriction Enzyme Adenine Methylase Associated/Protein of unknown function (DUF1524)
VAGSPINGHGLTVRQLFSGRRYRLDYYQREYSWSDESVKLLLTDLERRFKACWQETHDREQTADYDPYFLGPYVYYEGDKGATYLVDGQQRLTTLHLILIYIRQLLLDQDLDADAVQLEMLIGPVNYGKRTFTIDIEERVPLLTALMNGAVDSYELPADAKPSVVNLLDRSRNIDEMFPEDLRGDALPYFHDWLLDRVCLVGIEAVGKESGWEIFESMNDRGVRLGPVDLLKSYLLSKVSEGRRKVLDNTWRDMLRRLSEHGQNTASDFVKTILVAKYAAIGTESEDLRKSEFFHEWIRDNAPRLGLVRPSDYESFIEQLGGLADHYCTLMRAGEEFDGKGSLAPVFYNKHNGLGVQLPLIFAVTTAADQLGTLKENARLIASFVDLVYVRSLVNNDGNVDRIEADLRELIPALRACGTSAETTDVLSAEIDKLPYDFSGVDTLGFNQNRKQIRYLLARLTSFVDVECGDPNRCGDYLDSNAPWEIEHILPTNPTYRKGEKTIPNYAYVRSRVGALLLLRKSDNASYRDDPYEVKLAAYRAQNRLAASLHPDSHQRNPDFLRFVRRTGLAQKFRAFPTFPASAVDVRQQLYRSLCELVWSPARLGFSATGSSPASTAVPPVPAAAPRRARAHYGVEVADLLDVGLLEPGTELRAKRKGATHVAVVIPDGRLRLATGEVVRSLSAAGQRVCGTKSCQGWAFWHVERGGGLVPLADVRSEAIAKGLVEAKT